MRAVVEEAGASVWQCQACARLWIMSNRKRVFRCKCGFTHIHKMVVLKIEVRRAG